MGQKEQEFTRSFQEITLNGPIIFMHWFLSGEKQTVNHITPNVHRLFGYLPHELTSGQMPLLSIIFEEDRKSFIQTMQKRIAAKDPFWESAYRIYGKNGQIHYIKTYTYIKFEGLSNKASIYSYIFDQTDLKKEIAMHISLEHRWSTAIDSAREGVWDWNAKNNTVYFSKHWKGMLGYEEHEFENEIQEWRKRIHPEDIEKVDREIEKHVRNETDYYIGEHRLLHKDGTYRWILDRGRAIERDSNDRAIRVIGTHVDITESKRTELLLKSRNEELEHLIEQIKELSITDPLTSLYNRRKIIEEIEQAQKCYEHQGNTFTLAIIDLDYFKQINDRFGHTFGDEALKLFASMLKKNVRNEDVVARWGGEEFIVLFPKTSSQEAIKILDLIQELCNSDLLSYNDESVILSFSAGVCEYDETRELDDLIKFADQALYDAKSKGRNQIILY
ncbi:MAG: diguanylate cyclase [Paenisporosarcina sp.]